MPLEFGELLARRRPLLYGPEPLEMIESSTN